MSLNIIESNRRTRVVVFEESETGQRVAFPIARFNLHEPLPSRAELDAVNSLVTQRSRPRPVPNYAGMPVPIVRVRRR